jgi:hypothetical protein
LRSGISWYVVSASTGRSVVAVGPFALAGLLSVVRSQFDRSTYGRPAASAVVAEPDMARCKPLTDRELEERPNDNMEGV